MKVKLGSDMWVVHYEGGEILLTEVMRADSGMPVPGFLSNPKVLFLLPKDTIVHVPRPGDLTIPAEIRPT